MAPSKNCFTLVVGVSFVVALTGAASGDNPGFENPSGDIRADAPDDPEFDRAEPDDTSGDYDENPGRSVLDQQWNLFGFAPATTRNTAVYRDAARSGQGQVSGVAADRAWQVSRGDPDVVIAILDTGVRWDEEDVRRQVYLNCGELPAPQRPDGTSVPGSSPGCLEPATAYDLNGDGVFGVEDYAGDPRVDPDDGMHGAAGRLDGQDLIVAFSDDVDDDGNAYTDDISGWDFFDDDNDPFDASSYSSAENHGTGRGEDAAERTNDGRDEAGVCPKCRLAFLRIWDTFVPDANNWALATAYAADNGFRVTENAIGNLYNSRFAREVTAYAVRRGVAIMAVSSDLNTANHNYPTNYADTIFVSGIVPDIAPGADPDPPPSAEGGLPFDNPVAPLGAELPLLSWFRDSNITQYGGHHHLNMMGDTGSFATGQAAGAAGLLLSVGNERAGEVGGPLTANEVKQILTLTAEDVLPENTPGVGIPDPAQTGWDQHFGYGRVDLRAALDAVRVGAGGIPPEARIADPPWFHLIDPEQTSAVDVTGEVASRRTDGPFSYEIQVGPGIEPLEEQFVTLRQESATAPVQGTLAMLGIDEIQGVFPPGTDFSAPPRAVGPPVQGDARVPSNEFLFTLRIRVTDSYGNVGEDRRSLFLHTDPTLHEGWPKFMNTGGEQALKMADLTGDGDTELVVATSSGQVHVFDAGGQPDPGFHGGNPVSTDVQANAASHFSAPVFSTVDPPRLPTVSAAVGDLDQDGRQEIVVASGDRVMVWNSDGTLRFRAFLDPALSAKALRTKQNHVKPGILAAPALGDVDGDGALEIVVAAMDQRVYVWNDGGSLVEGFPVLAQDPAMPPDTDPSDDFDDIDDTKRIGAELITTPALGDLDGDGFPEIVVASNEVYASGSFPTSDFDDLMRALEDPIGLPAELSGVALEEALAQAGAAARVYAIHHDGFCHGREVCDPGGEDLFEPPANAFVEGWPVTLHGLIPGILPLIGPGFTASIADLDEDPATLEVVTGITSGNTVVLRHDGARVQTMASTGFGPLSDVLDPSVAVNLFEYPTVADINGDGALDILKGGVTLNGVVNLALPGQNLPFNHVVQAWDGRSGQYLPAFPKATDDYMLLSQPSVADVGSPLPGVADGQPEILVGTGMYLLHAYDRLGLEPPGWPKLVGGWVFGTPAVGDLDGDDLLEVAVSTREGFLFVFDTDGPASTNDQWWTFHHDEWNSGNVTTDPRG